MAESQPAAEGGKAGLVLRGGRVIDPESGFDAVADVAIGAGRVTQIGTGLPPAYAEVDETGMVVTAECVYLQGHVN
jgi:N-acyl-D-glutamate deacylase